MSEASKLQLAVGLAAIRIRGEFETIRAQEENAEREILNKREEAGPKVVQAILEIFGKHGQDEIKQALKGDDLGKAKERTPEQKNIANFRSACKVVWEARLAGWFAKKELETKFLYTNDGKARGFQSVVKAIRDYRDSVNDAGRTDDAAQEIARETMRKMGIADTVSMFQLTPEQHETVMDAVTAGLAKAAEIKADAEAANNTPQAKALDAVKRHYKANGIDWCVEFAQAYAQAVTALKVEIDAVEAAEEMPPVEMTERKAAA